MAAEWTSRNGLLRLVHGDAFQVLEDVTADGVLTDPPYGVDYTGGHFHSGDVDVVRERERLEGDADPTLWPRVMGLARHLLRDAGGPVYCFFASLLADSVLSAARANQVDPRAIIVWHKVNAKYAAMLSHYKHRWEPILYAAVERTHWRGASDEPTLWEGPRVAECVHHPTEKPTWVWSRMMRNHHSMHWVDPFMGAGSSALAAARAGVSYTGVELDRGYWEVAVERVQAALAQPSLFGGVA